MQLKTATTAAFLLATRLCSAARLSPAAEQAFKDYVYDFEKRLTAQGAIPKTYSATLSLEPAKRADAEHQLMSGAVRIEPVNGGTWQVRQGLLHHWRAAAFVTGVTPQEMLTLLRDCSRFSVYYSPQVEACHPLADEGASATVAIRFREQRVVTVVLDAVYAIESGLISNNRGYSFARSEHIWEVDEAGSARERRRTEGDDDGFLWHLNSYWTFLRVWNGLFIECDAVSLTRDAPVGLGWLITPIIKDLPRQSLEFTFEATKNALTASAIKGANR